MAYKLRGWRLFNHYFFIDKMLLLCLFAMFYSSNSYLINIPDLNAIEETSCLKAVLNYLYAEEDLLLLFVKENTRDSFSFRAINNRHIVINDVENFGKFGINNDKSETRVYGHFVIFEWDVNLFNKIKKSQKIWNNSTSANKKWLIFINNTKNEEVEMKIYIKNIYEFLWKNDVMDVSLFDGKIIVRANPYDEKNKCGLKLEEFKTTSCESENKNLELKFETTKLNNCNLTAGCLTSLLGSPYINMSQEKGILLQPISVIAQRLNMNFSFGRVNPELQTKFIENGSEEFFKLLYKNLTLLIAMPNREENPWFDSSITYYYNKYAWVVPKPGRISNISLLASIYTPLAWISILFVFSLVVLTWFLIEHFLNLNVKKKYDHDRVLIKNLMDIFALTLYICIKMPKIFSHKLLMMMYILFIFHINYYFQGKLSSVLTRPSVEQGINSVSDLVESQTITPQVYKHIKDQIGELDYPLAKKLYEKCQVSIERKVLNRLEYITIHKNISCAIYQTSLEQYAQYYEKVKIIGYDFLLPMEVTFPFRKGHPFIAIFNKMLTKFLETGLDIRWYSEVKPFAFEETKDETVVLTLEHVLGAYILYLTGIGLSLIIFITEILINVFKKQKYCHNGY